MVLWFTKNIVFVFFAEQEPLDGSIVPPGATFLNFQWILELVNFETLDPFSHSSFKIHRFSPFNQILLDLFYVSYAFKDYIPFNQILLDLFDVSYAFKDYIWVVYTVWDIFVVMLSQILLWNALEISNKSNKIWLKLLNSRILKDERLN